MSWSFEAIGTTWVIDLPETLTQKEQEEIQSKIRERIADFDAVYSRFRDDSLIARVAQRAGSYTFPPDADTLFTFYRKLYEVTGGAITPLIAQTLVDAGYDATYSLKPKEYIARPKPWDDVLHWQNPELTVAEPVLLDVGAAGKGYLIDLVCGLLEQFGIMDYCVDAGGDMRQRGSRALRVGLENPTNTTQVIGVATLHNASLCGSAGNRRAWGNFHHTIDPRTLTSPRHILAAWVIAEDTMIADGLATALFFAEPDALRPIAPFAFCLVKENGEAVHSPNFPAEFFTD